MIFQKLLKFSENQKVDIAAQKLQLGECEEAYGMLKDVVRPFASSKSLTSKLALSIFTKSGIKLAQRLETNSQYQEALTVLYSITALAPRFPDIHNTIGRIKLKLHDFIAAGKHLDHALELNPGYREAQLNRIKLAIMCQEYQTARHHLSVLKKHANAEEGEAIERIVANLGRNGTAHSLALLSKLAAREVDHTRLYLRLGIEFFNKERYKEAIPELLKFLHYKPDYTDVIHILGVCYMEIQDYQNALTTFRKALEINPRFTTARLHLALTLKATRRYASAKEQFEHILQQEPDSRIARRFIAELSQATQSPEG